MSEPKILVLDLESCGVNALKSDLGIVVCFGWSWMDEDEAHCVVARKKDLKTFSDKWLLKKVAKLMAEADLLVAHYGSVFDRRFIQGRLLVNKLPPIPATKMRDTCMIARSVANYSSNRLGHLANILDLRHQKQVKGDMWPWDWFRTMAGDTRALARIAHYCKKDVLATKELYLRLLPFDNAHPRMVRDRSRCGTCGGEVEHRGWAYVGELRYRRYVCRSCHRWGRERNAA